VSCQELLYFEADRRVMNIAVASLGTEMSASDKINLFPKHGHLFPNVHISLASCTTIDKIQAVLRSSASLCGYVGRLSTVDIDVFDKVRHILVGLVHLSWLVGSGTLRRRTKIM